MTKLNIKIYRNLMGANDKWVARDIGLDKRMKRLFYMTCMLLLTAGCQSITTSKMAAIPNSSDLEIVLGISMPDIIKAHGSHYKVFFGPTGILDMVYDDITVSVKDMQHGGGIVCRLEYTTPHIREFVNNIPYEDQKNNPESMACWLP